MSVHENKIKEDKKINERGKLLFQAFSSCHSLEKYNN